MNGYVVPQTSDLARLSREQRIRLRDRLIDTLGALDVPAPVTSLVVQRRTLDLFDPEIVRDEARRMLAALDPEPVEVVEQRRAVLLGVSSC
jgi:hypothetical protein